MPPKGRKTKAATTKRDAIDEAPEGSTQLALEAPPPPQSPPPPPPVSHEQPQAADPEDSTMLIERPIAHVELVSNPNYLLRLKNSNVLAYERGEANRFTAIRYYDINVVNLRRNMSATLTDFLRWRYYQMGRLSDASVIEETTRVVTVTVDACMSALYAKLRTIHKQYPTYAGRYTTPPIYHKDLELPLPFADAIQNFGVFETQALITNHIMVPTYPEGTRYEGRSTEIFAANMYETATIYLKMHGIPLKSVDTRAKFGTAWWTYKAVVNDRLIDLNCILPFLHYSNHTSTCATMFLNTTAAGAIRPIITYKDEDEYYGTKVRSLRLDARYRTFSALCQAPRIEWDYYSRDT